MTIDRPRRVLIVDDHPVYRQGICFLLDQERDLELCGEASTTVGALAQIELRSPDLVLVDLTLADGANGLELVKHATPKGVRTLVSSFHDESIYAERVLHAGASGYVHKGCSTDILLVAIRRVLAGKLFLSDAMSDRLLQRSLGKTADQPTVSRLTDRELEVFELLGGGLTTRDIAEQLHLSPKTIETYREHLKRKLAISTSPALVAYAARWLDKL